MTLQTCVNLQPLPRGKKTHLGYFLASLGLALTLLSGVSHSEEYRHILQQYKEPQKSEIRELLEFTHKNKTGKIISILDNTHSSKKRYRLKVLKQNGYLKTYYVNDSLTQISP
jgi:hypothetical protein